MICAEGFSSLLNAAEEEGKLQGVTIYANAPSITHLLFVNDSLLLLKVDEENVSHPPHILQLYAECSGQVINKDKSAVLFSQNTKGEARQKKIMSLDLSDMRLVLIGTLVCRYIWRDRMLRCLHI